MTSTLKDMHGRSSLPQRSSIKTVIAVPYLFWILFFIRQTEIQGFLPEVRSLIQRDLVGNTRREQSEPSLEFRCPNISIGFQTKLHSSPPGIRNLVDWINDEPLESLISKEETIAISRELTSDKALIDSVEKAVIENWDKIVQKLIQSRNGQRQTLSGLLGEQATQRLLTGVRNLDVYSDSKTVNAFLQSDAVNELFAQTLYDGIYEFFQTIDVFGNIISNLPVLGPIRNKIRDDLKQQLDRTLGPTLRSFLKGYTTIAIGRASSFVLSDQNRKAFGAANVRLVKSVLDRPLQDLLPLSSNPSITKLRSEFFGYLRGLGEEDSSDIEEYTSLLYDLIGDKSLDSVGLNVHRVLDASPTLESTANRILKDVITNASN